MNESKILIFIYILFAGSNAFGQSLLSDYKDKASIEIDKEMSCQGTVMRIIEGELFLLQASGMGEMVIKFAITEMDEANEIYATDMSSPLIKRPENMFVTIAGQQQDENIASAIYDQYASMIISLINDFKTGTQVTKMRKTNLGVLSGAQSALGPDVTEEKTSCIRTI